jgi:hypothetical protein
VYLCRVCTRAYIQLCGRCLLDSRSTLDDSSSRTPFKKSKPRAVPRSCTCLRGRNEPCIPHAGPPVSPGAVNSHLGNLCLCVCVCPGAMGPPRRPGIRDSPALCTVPAKARPGIRKGGRIWCQIAQHHGGATPCAPSIRPGDLPILPLACTGQSCWERHAAGGGALV